MAIHHLPSRIWQFPHSDSNHFFSSFPVSYSSLLDNSMLRRLLLHSSSFHRLFPHPPKLSSTEKYAFPSPHFSSLIGCPIHATKVSAMANTPTHSHKYTNRLASEHSPYLLQHAHNPVSEIISFNSLLFTSLVELIAKKG